MFSPVSKVNIDLLIFHQCRHQENWKEKNQSLYFLDTFLINEVLAKMNIHMIAELPYSFDKVVCFGFFV